MNEDYEMMPVSAEALGDGVKYLKEGYDFDALVIGDLQDPFMELSPKELVERFCYSGDVNNII